jgi:cobalt-precorrin-5B (C1)-methyltransferase
MIKEALREVCDVFGYEGGLEVIVSVPGGEKIAEKTFNPRLGIVGGISILGTSGIVEPMSEQALVDTIGVELRQRKAGGAEYVLLTPGNYGADFIKIGMELDPKWAVLTSNFIGDSVDICARLGFKGALIVGHAGKLVKLAGNVFNTHSKYGDCRMEIIAANAAALGLSAARAEEILGCAMVDDAIRILKEAGLFQKTFERLAGRIEYNLAYRAGELKTGAILFSKEYGFLCETALAQELLKDIVKEQSKEN